MPRIALTGGIACGKSLLSGYLNELGVETIDADDVVHEIIPDPNERRRIASEVFADPAKRRALEARIHPQVRERIDRFLGEAAADKIRIAVVPLLFEVHWEKNFDIISCVVSDRDLQISRMMTTRGYTRQQAEARQAAQWPVAEKAERSDYVIENDGDAVALRRKAEAFVAWLKGRQSAVRKNIKA